MKNHEARKRSLIITLLYFLFGCAWILFSDRLVQLRFPEKPQVIFFSVIKGLFYVLLSSLLFFFLTYTTLNEAFKKKEDLKKANEELKKSTYMYKELYQENIKKQALLKSLIDSVPDLIFYKDTNSVYMGCNAAFQAFAGKTENEIVGRTDSELFSGSQAENFIKMDRELLNKKISVRSEEKVKIS